jgi:hypothetical protein
MRMPKIPAGEQRTWQKQVDDRLKALDDMIGWLKKTFPPERKLPWADVVSLERANHYLELAALQISHLREARRQADHIAAARR